MKKYFLLSVLFLLLPAIVKSQGWDENLYGQIEQSIRIPQFSDKEYIITKYGAKSDGTATKNQKAIQKAIDLCSKHGGGKVVVPAGQKFITGAIRIKNDVNLCVEEGAVLEFAFEPQLYPIVETSWEGLDCFNLSPCVYAFKARNIAITGKGIIDGGGTNDTWWAWNGNPRFGWQEGIVSQRSGSRDRLQKVAENGLLLYDEKGRPMPERTFGPQDGLRPQLISFGKCEGVLIEDITLLRSPFWVIHPLLSSDITIRRVKMINDGPNGDGCDPESCDRVLIDECFFNTGDDCIAIKSGRNLDGRKRNIPSKNIIIRNCEMKNGHGGVVIGSEISGGCQNVFVHDCVMDSPNLERVLRIKTNSCRGGITENVCMKNVKVGMCDESVLKINLDYQHDEICCRGNYPIVRNIYMENVVSENSKYGVQIIGLNEDSYVYNILVKNCQFNGVRKGFVKTGLTRNVVLDNCKANGSLILNEMPYQHFSEWMTYSEMKRTPHSYLLDFMKKPAWNYAVGTELESMLDTYLRYGGDGILNYCQEYTDTMINDKGDIRGYNMLDYNLDNIRCGHFVTRMYQQRPEAKNLLAMKTMMKQLQDHPRTTADHVYWHKAVYAYQVWLDGIFMGLPFRTLTAPVTTSAKEKKKGAVTKIYDDAVDQLKATYQRTLDPETGLNCHAYDETRKTFWADPSTGRSRHCWGRAQGWYTMALIEVLDALPEDYVRRNEVIGLLQKDCDALLRWQDKKSGVWYQVMDSPELEGNYLESTCSAMFTYALLKAYHKGYVGEKYLEAGIKAYQGILSHFIRVDDDKTLSMTNCCQVAGLGPAATPEVTSAMKRVNPKGSVKENRRRDGSFAYYLSEPVRNNDPKAVGPFIWASLELEQMGYDIDIDGTIEKSAYIFTSFHEPSIDGLQYLYSYDGLRWDSIPGVWLRPKIGNDTTYVDAWTGEICKPRFYPENKVFRDPSIVQGPDGVFHLVWTTQWTGSKGFGYASSTDLIHWSNQRMVNVMDSIATNNVWAPELFYDEIEKQFLVIWSSQIPPANHTEADKLGTNAPNRLWYCTTKDFVTFSPALPYYDPGFNSIDAYLLKKSKKNYVLVVKDNRKPGFSNLFCAFSESPYGPFHSADNSPKGSTPTTTFGRTFSEGPCSIRLGNEWIIYYDQYHPQEYGAVSTTDFHRFTPIPNRISVPLNHKHGTIVKVPKTIINNLLK